MSFKLAVISTFVIQTVSGWTLQSFPLYGTHEKLKPTSLSLQVSSTASNNQGHSVYVSHEGRSCNVTVYPDETILSAMERTGAADQLAIPSLPSDCRRGNCLTCTGTHMKGSIESSLRREENGLAPHVSKGMEDKGFILTCSSTVVGDGLKLKLGENQDVWQDIYNSRFDDEETQLAAREASARAMRLAAESDIQRWTEKAETLME